MVSVCLKAILYYLLGSLDYTVNILVDLLPTCKRGQYQHLTGINIAFGLGFGKFWYLR